MQSAFSVSSGINPDETSEGRMKKEKKTVQSPQLSRLFSDSIVRRDQTGFYVSGEREIKNEFCFFCLI